MGLTQHHLSQINVARMIAPLESPEMAGFVAQLDAINTLAERSSGFVWRLTEATTVHPFADPLVLINLSVWDSLESLKAFTYQSSHMQVFRDRGKWFERPTEAHLAMWWIPAGHVPTVREAVDRLDFRRKHGDTAVAFSFAQPYPRPDEPRQVAEGGGLDLDGRIFVSRENTANGDAGVETRFLYRQSGQRVWATYAGGRVRFGSLVAMVDGNGYLDMRYQHVDTGDSLRTGTCQARPEPLPDGRIRLWEEWQWTNGDCSQGRSVVEEVRETAAVACTAADTAI